MHIDFNSNTYVSIYDDCPFWSAHFAYTILGAIKFKKHMNVLDIGTGTGVPGIEIADRAGAGTIVYGIDEWDIMIQRAEYKAKTLEVKNAVFKKASVLDIPFEDNFFDTIVSNNCLNNVAELDKALGECFRVLKPEGTLIQTFNLPETLKGFFDIFKKLLDEKGMEEESKAVDTHIFKMRKTIDFTEKALQKAGFKVTGITKHCFDWPFADGTSFFNNSFNKLYWLECWKNAVADPEREKIFIELENRLNDEADKNGGLYFKIPYACVISVK